MSLYNHLADLLDGLESVGNGHSYPIIAIVVIPGVINVVVPFQGRDDLNRGHTKGSHFLRL